MDHLPSGKNNSLLLSFTHSVPLFESTSKRKSSEGEKEDDESPSKRQREALLPTETVIYHGEIGGENQNVMAQLPQPIVELISFVASDSKED